MAFFDINNFKNVSSSTLNYRYNPTKIVSTTYEALHVSSSSSLIYYKFNYPSDNQTTLTYSENGISTIYKPKYFYIFGVLHNNITGLTSGNNANNNIVGELVIEHRSDTGNTLYSCFFLESPKSGGMGMDPDGKSIDKLFAMIKSNKEFAHGSSEYKNSVNIDLNEDIPANQSSLVYNDTFRPLNKVIIFTSPIPLTNKRTADAIQKLEITTELFSISAPADYQSNNNVNSPGSKGHNNTNTDKNKNNNDNEIYIDCNPVDASDEQIQTYKVPMVSGVMKKINDSDALKTSIDFFLFFVLLAVIYVFVPRIYKSTVIDNVNRMSDVDSYSNIFQKRQYNRLVRITTIDFVLSVIVFAFIFYFIVILGYQKKNFQYIVYGIALLILYTICGILIYINKLDSKYMGSSLLPEDIDTKLKVNNITLLVPNDLGIMIGMVLSYYYPSHPDQALFYMLAVWLITFSVFVYFYFFTTWTDDTSNLAYSLLFCAIPIGIPLLVFIIKS